MTNAHRILLALVLAAMAPSAARADADDVGHFRLSGYFALHVAGDADANVGNSASSAELDPTVGFGVRGEFLAHDYFAIGGLFELLTFEADTAFADEREAVLSYDVWARARYVFEISRDLAIEPYLGVPFGLSLAVLNHPSGGDQVWAGFNTGVLAGALLGFGQFGAFLELGWRHHQVFWEQDTAFGELEWKIVTNQFAMHFGGSYTF